MLIDLTHTITPDMPVYPGSPAPVFSPSGTLTRTGYRETLLSMVSHTGTHMDAPSHLLQDGQSLDILPLSQFCGRAVVVDVSAFTPGETITADFLRARNGELRSADFVLFYTGWETRWGSQDYFEDAFPVPDTEAAKYLVSCGLKGVGTDAFSVDRLENASCPAHRVLLSGGLVILESLQLKKTVERKRFTLWALPLKFISADGAPVRAVADFRGDPEGGGETP